jgi:hydrogenase maturation protein HypF
LAFENAAARQSLAPLADAFLLHNRDIQVPCDDSVLRPVPGQAPILLRRARGYVPEAIPLPLTCPETILGVGAQDKNTFCLAWEQTAVLSQHIGDLDSAETLDYYRLAIAHLAQLCQRQPTVVAHDLHPDYLSTRVAQDLPARQRLAVQHHHAHIAACLAEHGAAGPCLGVAFDGTGYGPDGTIWGGELLRADLAGYQRLGHLTPVVMPGGEAAIRQPARMAFAYLQAAFGPAAEEKAAALGLTWPPLLEEILRRQVATGWQSPLTTSAGRLFDALAAALDICRQRTYEGQPALELEMAAEEGEAGADGCYAVRVEARDGRLVLDSVDLFCQAVADFWQGSSKGQVAARFHTALAQGIGQLCVAAREQTGLHLVALSGGVWQNGLLLGQTVAVLQAAGFEVLTHRLVPPNDGGLALGQAAAAAARLNRAGT